MMDSIEDHFDIGGYGPTDDPMEPDAVLTFADKTGRHCKINAAGLVAAFLDMDREGLIPDPGTAWRESFDTVRDPTKRFAPADIARYTGLQRVDGGICECCEAECHAIFTQADDRFLIERWAVVTTVMLLTQREILPILPFEWYVSLGREYERICETGRRVYLPDADGTQHV